MRSLLLFSMWLAAIVAAGCTSTSAAPVATGPLAQGPTIVARDLHFAERSVVVPADHAFALVFDNEDSAPHNVAIYSDNSASKAVFVGDVFSGKETRTYSVPALAPGSYFFRCDIHSDMVGTVTVQ